VSSAIFTTDCKIRLGIQKLKTEKPKVLQGYVDINFAGDLNQRRSMTSYVFTVAKYIVSWKEE